MMRAHFSALYFVIGFPFCLLQICSTLVSAEVRVTQTSTVNLSREDDTVSSFTTCIVGNGKEVTEQRRLTDFSEIKIDGAFTVNIDIQPGRSLMVTGDENLLSRYETTVQNGRLFVSTHGVVCPGVPPKIRMTNDVLAILLAEGSADISISHLDNRTFAVQLDGASELQLSGKSEKFIGRLRGGNTLNASEFQSQETMISIDGAGEALVHAEQKLVVEIKGVGNILYGGHPHTIEQRIYGTGTIQPQ